MLRTRQDSRTDRLVAVCAHRGVSLALAAAIAVTDHVVHQQLPFLWRGLMAEPCHLATAPIALWWPVCSAGILVPGYWYLAALLVLATLPPPRRRP
jgi:hypothetical protein